MITDNKITQRARDRQSFLDWCSEQSVEASRARYLPPSNETLRHNYFDSLSFNKSLAWFHAGGNTLFGMLCDHGRFEEVRRYFQGPDDLVRNRYGWTQLHYFCQWFSPCRSDGWGDRTWTPAAADALHLLLDNGEDLFRPDNLLRDAVTGFDMASQELLLDAWHYLLTHPLNGDQQVMWIKLYEQFETRDAVTNGMRDYIRSCLHHHDDESFRTCLEECMELPATLDDAVAVESE
jgi:hypothetical protein